VRAEETVIQIFGREMKVELEGLTPIEVAALADVVTEKMREVQQVSGTADSSKLAMLACLHFAAELQQLKDQTANASHVDDRKIDGLIDELREAVR
jgi:cell division protein ZapA (FtsZ GTPase activity inhibitor)